MLNERRLIYADALIKYMCDHCGVSCNLEDECCSNVDAVENQPTVDAVEVVMCKDCKYWEARYFGYSPDGTCICLHRYHDAESPMTHSDHYCAYGEKSGTQPQWEGV